MIVVVPVCSKDISLAETNLEWCLRLDDKCDYDALISAEQGTDTDALLKSAQKYFHRVHHYTYDKYTGESDWPQPQNYAWQTTARYIASHVKASWFWWEADVTPLKPHWIASLDKEYRTNNQPFMGHIVKGMGHMNGVAIYPKDVAEHSVNALLCRGTPFDVMLWRDIRAKVHDAGHLMAHFPRYNGVQLSFNDPAAVSKLLDKGYVIFHGCNDGSLVELLKGQTPSSRLVRKLIRWFKPSDVGSFSEEAETMWQWDAGKAQEKGYSVLPYQECIKSMPSVFKQTQWRGGVFSLPLNGRECHYNCSVLRYNNQLQLITRRWLRSNNGDWHSSLVAWKMADDLFPYSPVEIRFPSYSGVEQYEDPRALVHENSFWIAHCVWRHGRIYRAHQSLSSFSTQWGWQQTINAPYGGNGYHVGTGSGQEKNWVWFRHDNAWHFVYSWQPHIVIRVVDSFHLTEYKTELPHSIDWPYGEVRGGTCPIFVGDEYVSFFHSSMAWKGRQKRYYMGAYAFSAKPPFGITRFTRQPLLAGSEEDTRILNGPLVVFPCGALLETGEWFITFGINDEASGWIKIPHSDLQPLLL